MVSNNTRPSSGTGTTNPVFEEKIEGDTQPEFSNIVLSEDQTKRKVPRRILHFSDGTLEEYSTDEDEDDTDLNSHPVDPKTLDWLPWLWHFIVLVSLKSLNAADFCGEKLAWFFGITSPKYQYAIDEFHRLKKEDQEDKDRDEREKQAEHERKTKHLSEMESGDPGGISNQAYVEPEASVKKN